MYSKVSNSYERSKEILCSCSRDKFVSQSLTNPINLSLNGSVVFHVRFNAKVKLPPIGKLIDSLSGLLSALWRVLLPVMIHVAKLAIAVWIGGGHV